MKKEIAAVCILVFIFAASLVNVRIFGGVAASLTEEIGAVRLAAERGDWDEAETKLLACTDHWNSLHGYTHIFIRHPEIDSTSDAFYELRQALAEQNAEGYPSALEKLCYHLHSIDEMEHVRPGSVL